MRGLEGRKEREEREGDGRINTTTDRREPPEDGGHPFSAAHFLLSKKGQHESERRRRSSGTHSLLFWRSCSRLGFLGSCRLGRQVRER
jgi:hypothetical protein